MRDHRSSTRVDADLDHEGRDDADQPDGIDDLALARAENVLTPARLGWSLLVLGLVGFAASLALSIEKVLKLTDPDRVASCSINIFLDCAAAMGSWQGALLGFPNPFIGVAAFPVVVTTGVVLLAGARLPRWYWLSLLGGVLAAAALVVFLVHTSVAVLGRLCPYCMVVWAVTIPLWWFTLLDEFPLPRLRRFQALVLVGWFALILALVLVRFVV